MNEYVIKNGVIVKGLVDTIFSVVEEFSGTTFTIPKLTSGTTENFALMIGSNGVVTKRNLGSGAFSDGGGTTFNGFSGTTNYVQKIDSSSGLTDTIIFDNGTNVGINNPQPSARLDIRGNLKVSVVESATTNTNNILVIEDREIKYIKPNDFILDASATQRGVVNNTPLQELGGVDKLFNGIRIGKGNNPLLENTVIGVNALGSVTTGTNNIAIGTETGKLLTTGTNNSFIGEFAGTNLTTGGYNSFIGSGAGGSSVSGSYNTYIGSYASFNSNNTSYNTVIGTSALQSASGLSTGQSVVIGSFAMYDATATDKNVAIGVFAMRRLTSGFSNVGIGHSVLEYLTTGQGNVVLGQYAGKLLTTGSMNNLIGKSAGNFLSGGYGNTIIGDARISTGSSNIVLGYTTIDVGNNNIILGSTTGLTIGNNNIAIGREIGLSSGDTNTVTIGDGVGNIAIKKTNNNVLSFPSLTIPLILATTGRTAVTREYLEYDYTHRQILVANSTFVQESWNGKTVFFEGNITLTVPATLPPQFEFSFICKKGFTISWAITSPFIWYLENPPLPMVGSNYQSKGYFLRELATNNIHLEF